MSCGVGCRCGSDPALLWLWLRPTAVALIRPLAWELPHAMSVALKRPKKKKKKKKKKKNTKEKKKRNPPKKKKKKKKKRRTIESTGTRGSNGNK